MAKRTVAFNDKIVQQAKRVAPTFEFPLYAQTAVREKIDNDRRRLGILPPLPAEREA